MKQITDMIIIGSVVILAVALIEWETDALSDVLANVLGACMLFYLGGWSILRKIK